MRVSLAGIAGDDGRRRGKGLLPLLPRALDRRTGQLHKQRIHIPVVVCVVWAVCCNKRCVLLIGNVLQVLNHLRLHPVLAEGGSEVRLGVKSSGNGERLGLHNNVTLGQAVDEVQHVVDVV